MEKYILLNMSGDDHFHAFLPLLKTFACIIFSIPWLVISIVLYLNGTSQYGNVIEHETGEWSSGVIVDFTAVT
jgi:hypothetical protein